MPMRSVLGCLLLVLAALSVLEVALDGAALRAPGRAQWRAQRHHQTVARTSPKTLARVSQRSQGAIGATPSAPLIATPGGLTAAGSAPGFVSPVLATVFVPPRV